ncbi:MAG: hypothetical protein V3T88_07915 [Nitrosomonadaceae bacterium]
MELIQILKMNINEIHNLLVNHAFFSSNEIKLAAKRNVQLINEERLYWKAKLASMKFDLEYRVNPEKAIENLKLTRLKT